MDIRNKARYDSLLEAMEQGFNDTPEGNELMNQVQAEIMALEAQDVSILIDKYRNSLRVRETYCIALNMLNYEWSEACDNHSKIQERLRELNINPNEAVDYNTDDNEVNYLRIRYEIEATEKYMADMNKQCKDKLDKLNKELVNIETLLKISIMEGNRHSCVYMGKNPPKVVILTDDYMKHDDLFRVVPASIQPDKNKIRKYIENGGVVEGVEIIQEEVLKLKKL